MLLFSAKFPSAEIRNSDRAGYSDLNPVDGGQSLYPMGTVHIFENYKRYSTWLCLNWTLAWWWLGESYHRFESHHQICSSRRRWTQRVEGLTFSQLHNLNWSNCRHIFYRKEKYGLAETLLTAGCFWLNITLRELQKCETCLKALGRE